MRLPISTDRQTDRDVCVCDCAEVLWYGRKRALEQATRKKKNKGQERAVCHTQPPLSSQPCGVISVASYRGGPQSQIRSIHHVRFNGIYRHNDEDGDSARMSTRPPIDGPLAEEGFPSTRAKRDL